MKRKSGPFYPPATICFFGFAPLFGQSNQAVITGNETGQASGRSLLHGPVGVKGANRYIGVNAKRNFAPVTTAGAVLTVDHLGYRIRETNTGSRSSSFRERQAFSGLRPLQKFG